ncbi:C39 family peptidase [Paenibacillus sp. NPDC058177]|uniref:C39 family peptidase n=1 Tax=Paenibacillus sp. NPDC058177 TaxID=3346369 RepID=UPI0036D82FED
MKHKVTSHRLNIEPYSQWEQGVSSPGSACGPATMAAILEYWSRHMDLTGVPVLGKQHFGSRAAQINHLYSCYGGRPWGMSVRGFVKGIRAFLHAEAGDNGQGQLSAQSYVFRDWETYKAEINAGRPVAIKFDKWTSLRWRGQYLYDYHWVVGIGYEEPYGSNTPSLIVHDNGSRYKDGATTPGGECRVDYQTNRDIITMVGLNLTFFQDKEN